MRVLVAMSGGVDSSVAAVLLQREGHDVTGVTMKLWGGESDTGCCSVSDVDDARRVADQLGIDHHVFDFSADFERNVVGPYVTDHRAGRTPNPCIECNRRLKFDRLTERASLLGFERLATGHHARIVERSNGSLRLARGADAAKDQSYVLYMLDQTTLATICFPVGRCTKAEVRALARDLGLRTAGKPDSQDVCFITARGRAEFLGGRTTLTPGQVIDASGSQVGRVDAVELVTVGQRSGLGLPGGHAPAYALTTDPSSATVTVGSRADLFVDAQLVRGVTLAEGPLVDRSVLVQSSAHGLPVPGELLGEGSGAGGGPTVMVHWQEPQRRVAPGQSVVFYEGDQVVGGGIAG